MSNASAPKRMNTAVMVKITLLAAMGFLLTFLKITIPIFPNFLDLELGQLPVIIGGLTMGPMAAVFIELIKNILGVIIKPVAGGVGQMANFLIGCAYIVPLVFVYKKKGGAAGFILGAIAGTLTSVIAAAFLNYYLLLPLYAKVFFDKPVSYIVETTALINSFVTNLETLIIFAIIPFNLLKMTVVSVSGYFLYSSLRPTLKFIKSPEETAKSENVLGIFESSAMLAAQAILFAVMVWSMTIDLRKAIKDINGYAFVSLFAVMAAAIIIIFMLLLLFSKLFKTTVKARHILSAMALSSIPLTVLSVVFAIIPLTVAMLKNPIPMLSVSPLLIPLLLGCCAVFSIVLSISILLTGMARFVESNLKRSFIVALSFSIGVIFFISANILMFGQIICGFLK